MAVATASALALTAAPAGAMPVAAAAKGAPVAAAQAAPVHTEAFGLACLEMLGPMGPLGPLGPIPQLLLTNPVAIPYVLHDIFFGSPAAGGILQVCAF
ncbi:MAG TPA: hypothetical protein VGR20_09825 [Acidimicrobiia bacterium]|nr:hypothetical protein [Acidimicrobiia bacterium]